MMCIVIIEAILKFFRPHIWLLKSSPMYKVCIKNVKCLTKSFAPSLKDHHRNITVQEKPCIQCHEVQSYSSILRLKYL